MNILLVEPSAKLREAIGTSLVTTGGHEVHRLPNFSSFTSSVPDLADFALILVNTDIWQAIDATAFNFPKTLVYKITVSKITEPKPVKTPSPDIWFIQLPPGQIPALSQLITEI